MANILSQIRTGFRGVAVTGLLTLLLFVALNLLAAWALRRGFASGPPAGALGYGMEILRPVYPGYEDEEIRALIREVATRPQVYEPFTQFKEGPVEGRYLKISEHGFRLGGRVKAWPPDEDQPSIFVFGGSTAFGYGVADNETIPAFLEGALGDSCLSGAQVYNFARPNYYSSQERVLFEQLLASGSRPDVAIFIDGLNEFVHPEDAPKYSSRLRYMLGESGPRLARRTLKKLPLLELLRAIVPGNNISSREQKATSPDAAEAIVERWLRNRQILEAVATHFGTRTLFVWQPVPVYGYDLTVHPFAEAGSPLLPEHDLIAHGYGILRARGAVKPPGGLWLGDLQRGRRDPLYVDRVHYTAAFSRDIALAIAEQLSRIACPGVGSAASLGDATRGADPSNPVPKNP